MKPLDMRALERHLDVAAARLQAKWDVLVQEARELDVHGSTMETFRALLMKVDALISSGERDVVAALKPYIRSCHTPAERIAMNGLVARIGREFRQTVKTQIIDMNTLWELFRNAEMAEDEFAGMISDILGEDEQ